MCIIEVHGQTESFEITSSMNEAHPFGDSMTGDLLECRVEKRKSSDTPSGVFEIHLVKRKDSQGRTWRDKLRPQDVVVIQMMNYQGSSDASGAGEMHTVMIGLINTISIGTAISSKGVPQRVIMVRGTDFGKIFTTGMVTYWSFLGATLLSGTTRETSPLYNFVDSNKLNARPDQIVKTLVQDLFQRFMNIQFIVKQSPHSIFETLALQLESFGGEFPANLDEQFLSGQGNFWSFFTKVCSPPFHELWVDTRRSIDVVTATDPGSSTLSSASVRLGKDNSCPTLIMRPTPFPYLKSSPSTVTAPILPPQPDPDVILFPEVRVTPSQQLVRDRWDKLKRHTVGRNDLTGEPFDEILSISDEEQYNFYLVFPYFPWLQDRPWILNVSGILDQARFKRYGYKPMMPTTSLIQARDIDSPDDPIGIFYTAMNWRIASWNVLNDWFESGYKTFKLLPHVHVGECLVDASNWQETEKEFYIESVVHHYIYNQRATTTLGLTRGLTVAEYQNIGTHLLDQGLALVKPGQVMDKYKQLLEAH